MKNRFLSIKASFCVFFFLCYSATFAASESMQVGGRLSLGNYENDLAGKLYLTLPEAVQYSRFCSNINSLQAHRHTFWVEKGRLDLKYGLYRDYWGGVARFFPKAGWGYGVYCYLDTIGQKREVKGDLDLSAYRLSETAKQYLIPQGQLFNVGIEGFSPYFNTTLNIYGNFFSSAKKQHAFYVLARPDNKENCRAEHLIKADEKSYYLDNSFAVDINFWRRFSNTILQVGGFHKWMRAYPSPVAYYQSDIKKYNNWGACIELGYYSHPAVKIAIKGSWDTWNVRRVSFALAFESLPKELTLYQPTRRYLMPVQYERKEELPFKKVFSSHIPWVPGENGASWDWDGLNNMTS